MEINKEFNNIYTNAKITILKSYWYNGEHWYKTKEFGDIPSIFEVTYNLKNNYGQKKKWK